MSEVERGRGATELKSEECVSLPSPSASELENNGLLRTNLLKLKQKIIDTSTLLDLYHSTKAELESSQKLIRGKTQEAQNLRSQIDHLLNLHNPLQQQVDAKQAEVDAAKEEAHRYEILFRSRESHNNQLKAELEEARKARTKHGREKKEIQQENDALSKKLEEQQARSRFESDELNQLRDKLHASEERTSTMRRLLISALPILRRSASLHEYQCVNEIERVLRRKESQPRARKSTPMAMSPPSPDQELDLSDHESDLPDRSWMDDPPSPPRPSSPLSSESDDSDCDIGRELSERMSIQTPTPLPSRPSRGSRSTSKATPAPSKSHTSTTKTKKTKGSKKSSSAKSAVTTSPESLVSSRPLPSTRQTRSAARATTRFGSESLQSEELDAQYRQLEVWGEIPPESPSQGEDAGAESDFVDSDSELPLPPSPPSPVSMITVPECPTVPLSPAPIEPQETASPVPLPSPVDDPMMVESPVTVHNNFDAPILDSHTIQKSPLPSPPTEITKRVSVEAVPMDSPQSLPSQPIEEEQGSPDQSMDDAVPIQACVPSPPVQSMAQVNKPNSCEEQNSISSPPVVLAPSPQPTKPNTKEDPGLPSEPVLIPASSTAPLSQPPRSPVQKTVASSPHTRSTPVPPVPCPTPPVEPIRPAPSPAKQRVPSREPSRLPSSGAPMPEAPTAPSLAPPVEPPTSSLRKRSRRTEESPTIPAKKRQKSTRTTMPSPLPEESLSDDEFEDLFSRSCDISSLLASVETYTKQMDLCDRWPREEESTFVKRRLKHMLDSPMGTSLQRQNVLLACLYDLTNRKNLTHPLESIIPGLLESYDRVHTSVLPRKTPGSNGMSESELQTLLHPSRTGPSYEKISLLHDLVWNLSRVSSHRTASHGREMETPGSPFLEELLRSMGRSLLSKNKQRIGMGPHQKKILLCTRFGELCRAIDQQGMLMSVLLQFVLMHRPEGKSHESVDLFCVTALISGWPSLFVFPSSQDLGPQHFLLRALAIVLPLIAGKGGELESLLLATLTSTFEHTAEKGYEDGRVMVAPLVKDCVSLLAPLGRVNSVNEVMASEQLFQLTLGLEVLGCYKGWDWTYKILIYKEFSVFIHPSSSEPLLAVVIHLMGRLCKQALDKVQDPFSLPNIAPLRARMLWLLQTSSPFSLQLQAVAARALLDMSHGCLAYLKGVGAWFDRLDPSQISQLPPTVQADMKLLRSHVNK